MKDLIFKPIISLPIMITFTIVMLVIVIINRKHFINRMIILVLLLIISQRPMLKNKAGLTYKLDIDVLFVIDNTASMNAIDVNNDTRLKAVINDCKHVIDKLEGASYAVVTFGNFSQVRMPFTNDAGDIQEIISGIKITDPTYAVGSSLDLPYEDIKTLLTSSKDKEEHHTVLLFISDGELTTEEKNAMNLGKYKDLVDLIDSGAVLGYGDANGGKIRITESLAKKSLVDSEGYLLDKTKSPYQAAISKIDENNLKDLASNLSVDYIHMDKTSKINSLLDEIIKSATKDKDDTEYSNKDLYYYFSMTLLIFLFIELLYYRRNEQ